MIDLVPDLGELLKNAALYVAVTTVVCWFADRVLRDRRLAKLEEFAAEVRASTGLRVKVRPDGNRFIVAAVAETAPDRGTVALYANPSPAPEVRAWLAGVDAGHRLREEFDR